MTQLTALKELAEKVEAGTAPDYSMFRRGIRDWDGVGGGVNRDYAWRAYTGSLDAAKALHQAMLGDRFLVTSMSIRRPSGETHWRVILGQGYKTFPDKGPNIDIECGHTVEWNCYARAWLLAIIRAKISELEA